MRSVGDDRVQVGAQREVGLRPSPSDHAPQVARVAARCGSPVSSSLTATPSACQVRDDRVRHRPLVPDGLRMPRQLEEELGQPLRGTACGASIMFVRAARRRWPLR